LETAQILSRQWNLKKVSFNNDLKPDGSFRSLLKWLQKGKKDETVALVGHEPDLSWLIGWLLTGEPLSWVTLKKGGACMLTAEGTPRKRKVMLKWLMSPSQLRKVKKDK